LTRGQVIVGLEISGVNGLTALSCAATWIWNEIAKILLERNADVNKTANDGVTSLFIASQIGHLKDVKWLVEEGKADSDKAKNDGATPLLIAKQKCMKK